MGSLVLLLGCAGVVVAAGLWAACLGLRSPVAYTLATSVIATTEVVATTLALSPGRWVTRGAMLASITVLVAAAMGTWHACGRPVPPVGRRTLRALRESLADPLVAGIVAASGVAVAYLGLVAVRTSAFDMDVLLYHLPRAALWKQQHAVAYVAYAPDERIDAMPPNAEIGALFTMVLSGGDRYAGLVQLTALVVIAVGIVGLARRFGLSRREGLFGAAVFCAFPVVAMQAPTALTDLAVAAPLVCSAYFLLGRTRAELALGALALGIALGTKFTAALAVPILLALVLVGQPAGRRLGTVLAVCAGLVAGSTWYAVNAVSTGSIDGGLAEAFAQTPTRSVGATFDRVYTLLVDLLDLPGSNIPGISVADHLFTPVIAVALGVVCVGLARRRKWLHAATVGLAAAPLALAGPLVGRWDRVLRFGYDSLWALGDRARPVFDPPGGFDAASSWYGPALVALLLGATPLVIAAVRNRRMSSSALVALAAPLAFIVVLAVVVVYDPLRGRFLAFPVALAVAAGSVVLSVRPLARVLVGLSVVTLSISVLSFNGLWGLDRWEAQSRKQRIAGDDPVAFRFLENDLENRSTIAVAAVRDTYLYPLWDARLRRTIRFVAPGGAIPSDADTFVVGPGSDEVPCEEAWSRRFGTATGWSVYSRTAPSCER